MEQNPSCPVGSECQLPIDIVLRSSDQVLIGAHAANLEQWSEGFPPADGVSKPTDGQPEIVDLTEDAETLKTMLQCMHKAQYPDIPVLDGEKLFALAHAAEKYRVHSAMAVCHSVISYQTTIDRYPLQSLSYAVKFNYPRIADLAAPCTLGEPLMTIKELFGNDKTTVLAWLEYRESYLKAYDILVKPSSRSPSRCFRWNNFYQAVQADLPRTPTAYLKAIAEKNSSGLLGVYEKQRDHLNFADCIRHGCSKLLEEWKSAADSSLASTPSFSQYT